MSQDPVNWIDPSGLDRLFHGIDISRGRASFKTPEEAAIDVIKSINPTSIKEDREYAGTIDRNPDGRYSASKPKQGGRHSSSVGLFNSASCVGFYHTHGAESPNHKDEEFSSKDKSFVGRAGRGKGRDMYLGTPSGEIIMYTPEFDEVLYITPPR